MNLFYLSITVLLKSFNLSSFSNPLSTILRVKSLKLSNDRSKIFLFSSGGLISLTKSYSLSNLFKIKGFAVDLF